MRKLISVCVLSVLAVFSAAAEIAQPHFEIPASEAEFSVDFIEPKGMKRMKFPAQEDLYVTRAYRLKSRGKEGVVTYSLFTDTGVSEQDVRMEVYMWTLLCTMNITGRDDVPQPSFFPDEAVRGEFNGDCGTTSMLVGPFKNDFLKDYAYAAVESFFRRGQGLVVRVFMANDAAFFGYGFGGDGSFAGMEAPFFDFYDSFRFRDVHHFRPATPDDDLAIACSTLDGMKEVKGRRQKNLPVSNSFELKSRGLAGAMTVSLFKDTGVSGQDYRSEVRAFTKKCLMDITGTSEENCPELQWGPGGEGSPFDCSLSALVRGNFGTDFLKGYGFFLLESFYVQGEGLAVRVFLANDAAFFGFDADGNYVTEECPLGDFYPSLTIRN